mmetsp:Transcript_15487/g.48465  ORF Transcript_15487/g.48465 Transcript_15487/m.48465 type:complete len:207 (+) Transcript_15487:1317-1937(+)
MAAASEPYMPRSSVANLNMMPLHSYLAPPAPPAASTGAMTFAWRGRPASPTISLPNRLAVDTKSRPTASRRATSARRSGRRAEDRRLRVRRAELSRLMDRLSESTSVDKGTDLREDERDRGVDDMDDTDDRQMVFETEGKSRTSSLSSLCDGDMFSRRTGDRPMRARRVATRGVPCDARSARACNTSWASVEKRVRWAESERGGEW